MAGSVCQTVFHSNNALKSHVMVVRGRSRGISLYNIKIQQVYYKYKYHMRDRRYILKIADAIT